MDFLLTVRELYEYGVSEITEKSVLYNVTKSMYVHRIIIVLRYCIRLTENV